MSDLQNFLDRWAKSPNAVDDDMALLYRKYMEKCGELATLKTETTDYLVPVKTKSGYVPGFDETRIGAVEKLSARIDETGGSLEEITSDILAAIELAGSVSMKDFNRDVSGARQRVTLAENRVKQTVRRAMASGNVRLENLENVPEVREANENLSLIEKEERAKIEASESRLADLLKIFERYKR